MNKNDKLILRYINDKLIVLEQIKRGQSVRKADRKSTKRNQVKMTKKIKWYQWLQESPQKI